MISYKIVECFCANGFTGDFCEYKTEQDHLLFVRGETALVFNPDGRLMEEKAVIDEQARAYGSCSTMLNGEAIIFGGAGNSIVRHGKIQLSRQVNLR